MKVFTINNQKGGEGKTNLAANMGVGLAQKGYRVLLIDADPQHNLSSNFITMSDEFQMSQIQDFRKIVQARKENSELNILEKIELFDEFLRYDDEQISLANVLIEPSMIQKAIKPTRYENLSIIPASQNLSMTDYRLKNNANPDGRLRLALGQIKNDYDVVIIDNSPFDTAITYNAIQACRNSGDLMFIPVKIDRESWEGLKHTIHNLIDVLRCSDCQCDFRIVPTMVQNTNIAKGGIELLREIFDDLVLQSTVRYQALPVQETSFNKEILIGSSKSAHKKSKLYGDLASLVDEVETFLSC
jgi:chromosome partitioning protein